MQIRCINSITFLHCVRVKLDIVDAPDDFLYIIYHLNYLKTLVIYTLLRINDSYLEADPMFIECLAFNE